MRVLQADERLRSQAAELLREAVDVVGPRAPKDSGIPQELVGRVDELARQLGEHDSELAKALGPFRRDVAELAGHPLTRGLHELDHKRGAPRRPA